MTLEEAALEAQLSHIDYEEEDLELPAEEFCKKYNCDLHEYEDIQKRYQEM